jgi:glucosamine--fructose-6-phosphate aminotransferase (isomerizing)
MSQAVMLLAIIAHMTEDPSFMTMLDRIPDAIAEGVKMDGQICEYAHYFRCSDSIDVISRGITYAAMIEAELKIQETSNVNAHAYAASDYAHGPFAITNVSRPYIFTLVDKVTDSFTMQMYERMSEKNIFAMGITNKQEIAKKFPLSLLLPEWCEGIEGIFASIVILQLFACYLAVYRGKNPDVPEGVSKTVVTI